MRDTRVREGLILVPKGLENIVTRSNRDWGTLSENRSASISFQLNKNSYFKAAKFFPKFSSRGKKEVHFSRFRQKTHKHANPPKNSEKTKSRGRVVSQDGGDMSALEH